MSLTLERVQTVPLRAMARELEDFGYDVVLGESGMFVNMADGTKIHVGPDGTYKEYDQRQLARMIISRHLTLSGLDDIPKQYKSKEFTYG